MDYKYIEQLVERYWAAETTLEEERILKAFFSQKDIPAEMESLKPLFTMEKEEPLGDDFDARMMALIGEGQPKEVKAREVSLKRRLLPLFRAAAVVAIVLTIGSALQAPWDAAWSTPENYADAIPEVDTVTVKPVQAERFGDTGTDSTKVLISPQQTGKDNF